MLMALARHRACTVVGAVVSSRSSSDTVFRVLTTDTWHAGLSGLVDPSFDQKPGSLGRGKLRGKLRVYGRDIQATDERRAAIPLAELLRAQGSPSVIDFLSLDIEGAEFAVLRDFPFREFHIRLMTIERPTLPLQKLLKANNYSYIRDHGDFGDQMWMHKSLSRRADVLSRAYRYDCQEHRCVRPRLYQPKKSSYDNPKASITGLAAQLWRRMLTPPAWLTGR